MEVKQNLNHDLSVSIAYSLRLRSLIFKFLFEFSLYINTANCYRLRYMKLEVNRKFI